MPVIPRGGRVYAIGDIHGRFDLMQDVLSLIEADNATRRQAEVHLIFLGDLIDRGPASASVIEKLARNEVKFGRIHLLMGNHEEVFLSILQRNYKELDSWLQFGGAETLISYGIDPEFAWKDHAGLADQLETNVPADHISLLESMVDQIRCGDYLFVHAGIRPGVDLAAQTVDDLRWIREPFLSDRRGHSKVVVHGHTIVEEVEFRSNRICIDIGAYQSGRLAVLGLEGTDRWVMVADREDYASGEPS